MPATASFVSGEWTDIVPHPEGYAQVALEQPGVAVAYVNGREVWRQQVGWGLYLRATVIDGRVVAAMQRADGVCVTFDGARVTEHGLVFGQNGVAWNGQKLYVLRSSTSSEEIDFYTGAFRPFTHKETSQGFHDPAGGIFWTDDARAAIAGLALGFTRGSLSIGQSPAALQLRLLYAGQYGVAYDGVAYEPRLVQLSAETWVASARTPSGALTLFLTPPFKPELGPPPPPTPPPPPPPDPKEPNVAVQDVPNYASQLRDVAEDNDRAYRNAHGDYECQGRPGCLTEEEANEFIRIAAYELNSKVDKRIGLNGKRATSTLSQDALCFRHDDGRESVIDVIAGAGGSSPSIVWSVVGHYRRAGDGQKWIQPQPVAGAGTNPSRPDPVPQPPPPAPKPVEFPSFVAPWDIFLEGFYRFRDNIHTRDHTGDSVGAGALAYFVPNYQNGTNDFVKRFGLPVHRGSDQDFADQWRKLVNEGVTRAINAYQRDQGRP